jgi:tetratricopeptide (TPR) repeat protein
MAKIENQQHISNKLKLGLEKQASGRLNDALAIYEEILQSHPDNFHALQLSGMISAQNNDFPKAFDYLSRAIQINDTEPNVLNNHGVVSKEMGFYEDALVSYGKAIQINPNHYEAHNNRGVVLKQLGESETAVKCYENAIFIKPDYIAAHFNRGNLLQEIGRLEEALEAYKAVINIDNSCIEAYIKCGLLLQRLGQDNEAIKNLQTVLALNPNVPELHNSFGVIYRAQGKIEQAFEGYQTALKLEPNYSEAHFNHGVLLQETGQLDDAIKAYDKALSIRPDHIEAYSNKAIIYRSFGDLESGLACLDKAIEINDAFAEGHCNRGLILQGLKRYDEAIASYNRTLELKPDYVEAMNNRGVILKDLGKFAESMASFYVAISLKKDYADAYSNLGLVFQEINQPDAAIMQYTKAISLKEDFAEAYFNRGVTLQKMQDYDAAIKDYQTAISKKTHFAQPHNNLGVIFHELQELELSVLHFDHAMEDPNTLADASWNRSLVLLTQGNYLDGWKEYEWRRRASKSGVLKNRVFHKPLWLGKESLENKTILVVSEQGLGDTLQFCRYVPMLAKLGAKVIFEVQKPLLALMKGVEGVSSMTTTGIEPAEPYDCYCPLMSLPHAFQTTLETIPNSVPYIASDPVKTEYWAKKLGKKDKVRIGLVWSGGFRPDQPEVWATNTRRNLPLEKLATFKDIDAEFYSLQKGDPAESELIEVQKNGWDGPAIINYASELKDFTDTAALIENLDLVIAVDTSTAHLAAALGKQTWILNRFDTCWRWLQEREDSPWYPSIKLFRQKQQGDWDQVLQKIDNELTSNLLRKKYLNC